jgi:hypothetical protein
MTDKAWRRPFDEPIDLPRGLTEVSSNVAWQHNPNSAVQQRRLPGRGCRGADEDQDAHHIKRIEQDRWCEPDVTEHVADLRGEKNPLATVPRKRKSIGMITFNVAR